MRTFPFGLALIVLVGSLFAGGCSSPETLRTHSLPQAPSIDGALSDWDGRLTRLGDSPVSMSVAPTDTVLYVALLIPDRDLLRSVARNGLVVWVDPSGKQVHAYGVQYPLGLSAQRPEQKETSAPAGSGGPSTLEQLFPSDLALIRNDTVRHRMPAGLSSELRVQATLNTGSLIYELAIPLSRFAAEVEGDPEYKGLRGPLGPDLAVGLETPDPDDESKFLDRSPGVPSVTGRRGGRRSPRGRRGRRRQRSSPASQTSDLPRLDLWTRVVSGEQGM